MEEVFDVVKVDTEAGKGLREVCKSMSDEEIKEGLNGEQLGNILDKMFNTMIATKGVGIAGPQVGVQKRIFVIGYAGARIEFVNPIVVEEKGAVEGSEGCLSVPGKRGIVIRPNEVLVKFKNRNGDDMQLRATGYLARIICHENDHLDGILYTDKAKEIIEVNKPYVDSQNKFSR